MRRRRVVTWEAALWLAIISLSLKEAPGKEPEAYDKIVQKSQRSWCEETNACAGCKESKPPKCLRPGEPLLGTDLCGCCFSCVVVRDLGESCGSQLSEWPNVPGTGLVPSSVTILSTTWCREGLVCVNFVCLESSGNVDLAPSQLLRNDDELLESKTGHIAVDVFGQDMIPLDPEAALPSAKRYHRTTASPWNPKLVNHGDPNLPTAPSLTELRKKPQPCYAASGETMTISSYPSDDLLGQVATTTVDDSRFQIVYSGDLLAELKVLLKVVDRLHEDGLLDSLVDGFSGSLLTGDDRLLPDDEDCVEVSLPFISGSQDTAIPSGLHNLTFPGHRARRELDRTEQDAAGLKTPNNVQEILIRSASAHQEYVRNANSLDKIPIEQASQGDESTVKVHITNLPRKAQTLIDLEEEDEEEETEGEDRCKSKLASKARAKGAGRLSPLSDDQIGVSSAVPQPFATTEPSAVPEKTGESIPQAWNEALATLNTRLTLAEMRITVFERFLEEMAKWCNLGVLSTTTDCLVPQNSDVSYSGRWVDPEADERLAVASGVDAVRIRGNRRKSIQRRIANETLNPKVFRTIAGNNRPSISRRRGPGRPCRYPENRGSSSRRPIADAIGDLPAHKAVHRSLLKTDISSSNSSGLESSEKVDETAPRDRLAVQETQIPVPTTSAKKVTTLRDVEKRESPLLEDDLPQGWASAAEVTSSSDLPSWKTFLPSEKNGGNEEDRRLFARMRSGLQGRNTRRRKRAAGISPTRDTRKISVGLPDESIRRAGKLFQKETSTKRPGPDVSRNLWLGKMQVMEDGEGSGVTGQLILKGNSEFRSSSQPVARRLLFRNSGLMQRPGSTATAISMDSSPSLITSHGNSTIRIEEISEAAEYEDDLPEIGGSSIAEDDFDHIYEGVEAEGEEDFEYDVAEEQIEYVDDSSVEIPSQRRGPVAGLKPSRGGIHSVLFPHERSRRTPRSEDDQCELQRPTKREMPLLSFGSTEKHDTKTIVWPSKWIGYRRDRLLQGAEEKRPNFRSWRTGSPPVAAAPIQPTRTTETLITRHPLGDGETNDGLTPKISGLDRRGRKNRRKLVWR